MIARLSLWQVDYYESPLIPSTACLNLMLVTTLNYCGMFCEGEEFHPLQ